VGESRGLRKAFCAALIGAALIVASAGTSFGARGLPRATPTPAPQAAVINVTVVSAERVADTLAALFPRDHIRVEPNANAVVVVAPPDDLTQMRAIAQGIDVRSPSKPLVEVIPLHVLKPAALVTRLLALYPAARIEAASKQSVLVRASSQDMTDIKAVISSLDVAPPNVAPSSEPADAIKVEMAQPRDVARALAHQIPGLRASVSGSAVILVGSADDIAKAKTLAQAMDAPPFGAKYTQVYRLHNVDAQSVADLISRSYPNLKVTVDKDLNAISILATAGQHEQIAQAINQLDAAPSASGGGGGAPAYGDGNIDVVDLTSAMPGTNGAQSTTASDVANAVQQALGQMAPDLHITVPANSTEIVLAGSPQSIRLAKELIGRLDRARPLVILDTEVLEVDENVARNLGLSLPGAVLSTTFGEIAPTPDPNGLPGKIMRLQGFTRTPLQFTAALNLLIQNGNARVLADPRVTTVSGNTASIRAGDSIAILTQTGGGVGTPVTQQLQTFNTGVTLDITPVVGPSDNVTVALHPVVNSLEGLVNGIPQIATRDTQTVVQLQDNQTLVIGGLIQETSQHSVSKIPLLGDIPLVGRLFQNSDTEYQRNELVIVVTPHIIHPGEPVPPPNASLPIPTPQPLPTLPPGTRLPVTQPQSTGQYNALPAPREEPSPVAVPTPSVGPVLNTPVPLPTTSPAPTPTAFASTNVFVYGSPPPNTYARDTDTPQIYYVQFAPTILRNGSPVQVFAVTTTNVNKVTVGYPGYMVSLSQVGPSKWQGNYNFNAAGVVSSQNTVNLTMNAYRVDGTAATITIPVNLLGP